MSDDRRAAAADYQRRRRAEAAEAAGRTPGQIGRPRVAGCGTPAAYKRHRRAGEDPCEPCRAAWSEYQRELYQRRKATS